MTMFVSLWHSSVCLTLFAFDCKAFSPKVKHIDTGTASSRMVLIPEQRAFTNTYSDSPNLACEEEMLYSFFTKVAPVATVRVVRDTKTLQSEQHGYVNFYTFQDAEKVLKTLDGSVLYRQSALAAIRASQVRTCVGAEGS